MSMYSSRSIVFIIVSLSLSYLSYLAFTSGSTPWYKSAAFPVCTIILLLKPWLSTFINERLSNASEAVYVDDHIIRRMDVTNDEPLEEIA